MILVAWCTRCQSEMHLQITLLLVSRTFSWLKLIASSSYVAPFRLKKLVIDLPYYSHTRLKLRFVSGAVVFPAPPCQNISGSSDSLSIFYPATVSSSHVKF